MDSGEAKHKAEKLTDKVFQYSGEKLSGTEDITRLLTIAYEHDKLSDFKDLIFSAKYAQGLMKIIKNRDNDFEQDYFEKIKKEYMESIVTIRGKLKAITDAGSDFIKKVYEEKFFLMTQESMNNLNTLTADLEWVKLYLNEHKDEL